MPTGEMCENKYFGYIDLLAARVIIRLRVYTTKSKKSCQCR